MKLYESIDRLLLESPESLGFPRSVANEIREFIEHRKAQDYVARWFKELEDDGIEQRKKKRFFKSIVWHMSKEDVYSLAKSMGVLYRLKDDSSDPDKVRTALHKDLYSIKSIDDYLTVRKKIDKSLDNGRSRQETLGKIDSVINRILRDRVIYKYPKLIEFLNSDENAYRKLKGQGLEQANRTAKEEVEDNLFDESRIELTFPDGSFWYRIDNEKECSLEGDRMQHCGQLDTRTSMMYSLRDENNKSHITVEYNNREESLPQVRGKQNRTPVKKYWRYLPDLVTKVLRKKLFFTDFDAEDADQPIGGEFRQFMSDIPRVQVVEPGGISGFSALKRLISDTASTSKFGSGVTLEGVFETGPEGDPEVVIAYTFNSSDLEGVDVDSLNPEALSDAFNHVTNRTFLASGGFESEDLEEIIIMNGELIVLYAYGFAGMYTWRGMDGSQKLDTIRSVGDVVSQDTADKVKGFLRQSLVRMGAIAES